MKKIIDPTSLIIEQTAIQMAAEYYEIGRGQGLKSKSKNAKIFARRNFEKFIPIALQHLMSLLNRKDIPDDQKEIIYRAIMERSNAEHLAMLDFGSMH